MTDTINVTIGLFTLLSHIVFVGIVLLIAAHPRQRTGIYSFVHKHILTILFLESAAALVGSLVYSQIAGFPPCELCWIQRVFIYPQAIITLLAMIRKDKQVVDYLLPLSVIGALVALYQSLIQWGISFGIETGCVAASGECARIYVSEFGYITLPFMSFTIFAYSIGVMLIYYQARKVHG